LSWGGRKVIVTGGAGFIGRTLVEKLLARGAKVTVVDKLQMIGSNGVVTTKVNALNGIYAKHGLKHAILEILDLAVDKLKFKEIAKKHDTVFHLSAVFGGREFVDIHQAECSEMLAIDHNVISASYDAGIERFHYASSACVYAPSLNTPGRLLKEDDVLSTGEGWASSDNLYGFAKLMGEMQLLAFHREHGFKGSACRYLTVYGPGELDSSHAIAALVEKALKKQDPFEVWGSGNQERGFTYIDDIADGSLLTCEKIEDGTPVNLGWDKRYTIKKVVDLILKISQHTPDRIYFNLEKPEGPFSRALDISRARELLGWQPKVDLEEGLQRTIDWHMKQRSES
jgi:UDP-glucose 4-epimerase